MSVSRSAQSGRGVTLVEFVICGAVISLALAAVGSSCRLGSRRSEAKTNLKGLFWAERAYYLDKGTYSPSVWALGFIPERGNRYSYFTGGSQLVHRTGEQEAFDQRHTGFEVDRNRWPELQPAQPTLKHLLTSTPVAGETGCAPAPEGCVSAGEHGSFLLVAAGARPESTDLDNWLISSMQLHIEGSGESAEQVAEPGTPVNNVRSAQ